MLQTELQRERAAAVQVESNVALDAEIASLTPAFPGQIYNYASNVVTTGDGIERAHAAEVMCRAAERWPSWPVSQRKGHAVATVDDALLALSVGMQDMCAVVRCLASASVSLGSCISFSAAQVLLVNYYTPWPPDDATQWQECGNANTKLPNARAAISSMHRCFSATCS